VNWAFLSANSEHPFAQKYADRLDLGLRAKAVGQLGDLNDPADFISWAKRLEIAFPRELESAITLRGNDVRDWQAEYERLADERNTIAATVKKLERELSEKPGLTRPFLESERESVMTIIAGMADGGYKYVPTGNSKVPQEVANDIVTAGLSLDVKTIRKYLQAAANLLPTKGGEKA